MANSSEFLVQFKVMIVYKKKHIMGWTVIYK